MFGHRVSLRVDGEQYKLLVPEDEVMEDIDIDVDADQVKDAQPLFESNFTLNLTTTFIDASGGT